MATVVTGLVAGIVGAILMVPTMQIVQKVRDVDLVPPFAVFWAQYVGDGDPEDAMPAALVLHLIYGAIAGLIYVPVFRAVGDATKLVAVGQNAGAAGAIVWGIVWAVVLLVGAMAFWGNVVLDMEPDQDKLLSMGSAHLVYGLTVGLWVAFLPP